MYIDGAAIGIYRQQHYPGRPTLIFLHDSLGCIQLWRSFPQHVAALTRCNLLIYDRQGYGTSADFTSLPRDNSYMHREADVLYKLIELCNIEQPILFGHSDGGSIALITAAAYPHLLKGIITVGAHIFVEDVTIRSILAAQQAYLTTDLREKLQKYHGAKTDHVFSAWADTWLNPQYRNWSIEQVLPNIICPVLVIQGTNDEYGSIAQVSGIVNNVAGYSESFLVPNAGHNPHKEQPEEIATKTASFIAQHCF
jgi:pimeloyl-ACP methyl ester carboxylesterase